MQRWIKCENCSSLHLRRLSNRCKSIKMHSNVESTYQKRIIHNPITTQFRAINLKRPKPIGWNEREQKTPVPHRHPFIIFDRFHFFVPKPICRGVWRKKQKKTEKTRRAGAHMTEKSPRWSTTCCCNKCVCCLLLAAARRTRRAFKFHGSAEHTHTITCSQFHPKSHANVISLSPLPHIRCAGL